MYIYYIYVCVSVYMLYNYSWRGYIIIYGDYKTQLLAGLSGQSSSLIAVSCRCRNLQLAVWCWSKTGAPRRD